MKLLPKVHKLTSTASPSNLDLLTGRPIITAHSWTTSNVSKLLGTKLDNIIKQLKDLFHSKNIHFPLIYNSSELIDLLQQQHVTDINNSKLTTFDFTSLYTKISFQDTINAIVSSCKLLNFPNFYRDFLLNLNDFINNRNFFSTGVWAEYGKMEKRVRQLDFIFNRKEAKTNIWFYLNMYHSDWRFLDGTKRQYK